MRQIIPRFLLASGIVLLVGAVLVALPAAAPEKSQAWLLGPAVALTVLLSQRPRETEKRPMPDPMFDPRRLADRGRTPPIPAPDGTNASIKLDAPLHEQLKAAAAELRMPHKELLAAALSNYVALHLDAGHSGRLTRSRTSLELQTAAHDTGLSEGDIVRAGAAALLALLHARYSDGRSLLAHLVDLASPPHGQPVPVPQKLAELLLAALPDALRQRRAE